MLLANAVDNSFSNVHSISDNLKDACENGLT